MRTIQVQQITEQIKEMCIQVNHYLSEDMEEALRNAQASEKSPL